MISSSPSLRIVWSRSPVLGTFWGSRRFTVRLFHFVSLEKICCASHKFSSSLSIFMTNNFCHANHVARSKWYWLSYCDIYDLIFISFAKNSIYCHGQTKEHPCCNHPTIIWSSQFKFTLAVLRKQPVGPWLNHPQPSVLAHNAWVIMLNYLHSGMMIFWTFLFDSF